MMRAQLDDVHARGEPLALLWASEDTIYGRFGYGMASQCADVSIPRQHSAFARPVRARGHAAARRRGRGAHALPARLGRVRRRDAGHARALAQLVGAPHPLRAARAAGARAARSASSSSSSDGRPEGYAIYRHKPKWEDGVSNSELEVVEAVGARRAPTARALALPPRHRLGRADDGEPAAGRPPALVAARRRRGDMRPRDRRRALGAARRRRGGAVRARVRGGRRGRLRRDRRVLPVERGPLAASRAAGRSGTTAAPQLRLDVSALGSAYLGGFTFSELVRGGPGRGAAPRRRRACGRDVRVRARARGAPRSSDCAKAIVRPDDRPYDPDILSAGA